MDNLDLTILTMIATLVVLHCIFFIAALTSKVDICLNRKLVWSAFSLIFGPIGYYAYQGRIPCEVLAGE
ncbi:hypothetical protein [Shewanella gelidii]|uniref:Uncharacterized protein n=1 Tax=Shewanella gelidii TaxID=1642821 RepID=A0A917N8D4_9GAMM|nr:hypothetical protein [Shewanella gelidii]MCL1099253.1 hypothetical protein [Shewanella gelidii]GGI76758.1 hypothetical protein GCM10009332_12720 [Shewanella gelidii]